MKQHAFISTVIYVQNDARYIEREFVDIVNLLDENFEKYEVIVVNDHSSDGTKDLLQSLAGRLMCNFTILNLSRRHGLEFAMTAGLEKSIGDFVIEIDSLPLESSSEIIMLLYAKIKEGFDIVVASPSANLSLKSKLFYKIVNRMSYLDLNLYSERIRVVSRRALNAMLSLREKVRYRKALYSFTGFSKEIIYYAPNKTGKITPNRENISLAVDVIISFSSIGLKLSHYFSFVFAFVSLIGLGYGLFNFFFNQYVIPGWTTLVVLISLGFSGVFFVLGIIGEYLARILIEVQNRPIYTISSIEMNKPLRVRTMEQLEVTATGESQNELSEMINR